MSRTLVLDAAAVAEARRATPGADRIVWPAPLLPAQAGSTNEDLVALGATAPHLSLVATLDQVAGRGRLDRAWVAPPGACLAMSTLLRAPASVAPDALGWATVLVALVAARTVDALAGERVAGVKWPNDLLVRGSKCAGILARLVPGAPGEGHTVVVGIGVNLDQSREELPVGTATSLALSGLGIGADELLGSLWGQLGVVSDEWFAAGGSVTTPLPSLGGASVLEAARESSSTLGNDVRVHLPGGHELVGVASDLDADGCLMVTDAAGEVHHVHAGDVVHLRRSDGGYA
ncbi:MAG: biotin--[acetyl-CoA-carboxylase] ligase [Arthrobacter sp.]|nr:biotin--[acetyl-CoA-carboxylase] ligase [Arthrobacter sp.]